MKKILFFVVVLTTFVFSSCSNDDGFSEESNDKFLTVIGKLPQNGTTRMSGTDESVEGTSYSMKFGWETGDQVRFYYPRSSDSNTTAENTTATITGDDASFTLALSSIHSSTNYLYSCTLTSLNTNNVTFADVAGSSAAFYIDNINRFYLTKDDVADNNPMIGVVAKTNNATLNFKNCSALLKITLTFPEDKTGRNIPSNKLKITNSAGKGIIGRQYYQLTSAGVLTILGDGTADHATYPVKNASLQNNSIIDLSGTTLTFYVIAHPQTLSNGMKISVTDDQSTVYTWTKTGKQTLEMGKMYRLNATLAKE